MAAMTTAVVAEMTTETEAPEEITTVGAAMKASGEEASVRMTTTVGAERNSAQSPVLSNVHLCSIRMQAVGVKNSRAAATADENERAMCERVYT